MLWCGALQILAFNVVATFLFDRLMMLIFAPDILKASVKDVTMKVLPPNPHYALPSPRSLVYSLPRNQLPPATTTNSTITCPGLERACSSTPSPCLPRVLPRVQTLCATAYSRALHMITYLLAAVVIGLCLEPI